jgi:hypothetical protein
MKKILVVSTILMLIFGAIFIASGFLSVNTSNYTVQDICTVAFPLSGLLTGAMMLFICVLTFQNLFRKK